MVVLLLFAVLNDEVRDYQLGYVWPCNELPTGLCLAIRRVVLIRHQSIGLLQALLILQKFELTFESDNQQFYLPA